MARATNSTAGHILPVEAAFVVQFSAHSAPSQGLASGRVEHVRTGKVRHFSSTEDLLSFLTETLRESQSRQDTETG